jgi:capsular exopolysaccharide synthesis family protein
MSNSLQKQNNGEHKEIKEYQYIPHADARSKDSDILDPHRIIALLLKYKWIVICFLILGGAGAMFYANIVTPKYQSNGTLLISSADKTPSDELSKIISQTTGHGTSSTLINELEVLQSRKFSLQVAGKLLEEKSENSNEFPILWGTKENGDRYITSEETIANRVRKGITFKHKEEESDVIEVSFISSSSKEASEVVNLAMQAYIETSKQQNRRAAQSTADFLKGEKEKMEDELRESEQKLRSYMDATGIVNADEQATGMVAQKSDTEAELRRISLELESINENIANYENRLERIKPGLSEQFSEAVGPRIRNSQEQLAGYEQERSLIVAKNPGVLEREPLPARIQYLDKEIARLKGEIDSMSTKLFTNDNEFMGMNSEDRAQTASQMQSRLVELRMQKKQLESRQEKLSTHKNEMDANFNSLPEEMVGLAKLQRKVRVNEEQYLNVLRQYADMAILKQTQFGFGRIVDSASIPNAPVSPNKKMFMILGIMLGGFLVTCVIAIKEFRDNSINNVGQLKTIHLPPLTVIPSFDKLSADSHKSFSNGKGKIPKELVLLHDRSSIVSEAVRRLKNNIIYQYGETPPKTIAITSAEKGDGKSTMAANLGVALAEDGYWTLIIDADFRRPKLHKYFGLSEDNGLTSYLWGESEFDQLLQETDVETLKVISAGQDAKISETINNSNKFKKLLSKMKEVFDVIILDTPPYGIISDTTALLKQAEATVVVARYRKTNRGMLFRTMEELEQIDANVINIVLNGFDHRKESSSYYGSGYYQSLYSNYEDYL